MTRLLLAPDVAIRLDPDRLPLRLREGPAAALDRRRAVPSQGIRGCRHESQHRLVPPGLTRGVE